MTALAVLAVAFLALCLALALLSSIPARLARCLLKYLLR